MDEEENFCSEKIFRKHGRGDCFFYSVGYNQKSHEIAEGQENGMNKTLVIMAAGLGSRYGGLKQVDGMGPHGERIMDYSIYDAVRAGFHKVVFIIRKEH